MKEEKHEIKFSQHGQVAQYLKLTVISTLKVTESEKYQ